MSSDEGNANTAGEKEKGDPAYSKQPPRITKESLFMILALWMQDFPTKEDPLESNKNRKQYKKVGAVLVSPNSILRAAECTRDDVHAIARLLYNHLDVFEPGSMIYVSRKPCSFCTKLLVQSGKVTKVFYWPFEPEYYFDNLDDKNFKDETVRVEALFKTSPVGQYAFWSEVGKAVPDDAKTAEDENMVEKKEELVRGYWDENWMSNVNKSLPWPHFHEIKNKFSQDFQNTMEWMARIIVSSKKANKFKQWPSEEETPNVAFRPVITFTDNDKNKADLQKEQAKLEEEQAKLEEEQAKLQQEQAKLQQEQAEFQQKEAEFQQKQAELQQNQAELQQNQAKLQEDRAKLQQEQAKLQQEQDKLEDRPLELQCRPVEIKVELRENKVKEDKIRRRQVEIEVALGKLLQCRQAVHLLTMAEFLAQRTDDPVKGVGAIITNKEMEIRGLGWNGFPMKAVYGQYPRASDDDESDDTKFPYVIHAEQNALQFRNDKIVEGGILFVTKTPCDECAPLVKMRRIETVVVNEKIKLKPPKKADAKGLSYAKFPEMVTDRVFACFEREVLEN